MSLWPLFIAGITDSYNPCSVGVLLISLTILVGLGKKKLIAIFGLSYLLTIFTTYFLIGLGLLRAFHMFGIHGFFGYVGGVILILAGIVHLFPMALRRIPVAGWLNRCHIPTNINQHLDKGVFIAGIILGFLIGLCTIPCAGGIYIGAIALLATKANYLRGVLGIFIFNLGFILPLSIVFFVSTREGVLKKIRRFNARVVSYSTYAMSAIMIIMGVILILIANR
ncbi:MAG: cytochrome c biogenesis protein CcdA [bacterium]|nr:cytochrome c biogenesis protein CcdA [bacterium]